MEPNEIHAKAIIAAALIASHAVEVPRIPSTTEYDSAKTRLRELTDYVYRAITGEAS
jgi:hypothetical protein